MREWGNCILAVIVRELYFSYVIVRELYFSYVIVRANHFWWDDDDNVCFVCILDQSNWLIFFKVLVHWNNSLLSSRNVMPLKHIILTPKPAGLCFYWIFCCMLRVGQQIPIRFFFFLFIFWQDGVLIPRFDTRRPGHKTHVLIEMQKYHTLQPTLFFHYTIIKWHIFYVFFRHFMFRSQHKRFPTAPFRPVSIDYNKTNKIVYFFVNKL